ncbi:MAG: c-type cytochrome [Candidatus Binatia bacterium]
MSKAYLTTFIVSLVTLIAAANTDAGPLDTPGASKVLVCSACHGFNGNSPGNAVPILAGMAPSYFKKAINDYAAGKRPSPEMEPYAKYVIHFGLDEIADYFAVQRHHAPARTKADAKMLSRGTTLATQCTSCHGAQGEGDAFRAVPKLQGQPALYLKSQMALFGSDKRKLDDAEQEKIKKTMFKALDPADFDELAAYYAILR